jgi:hypothetical protein
LFRTSLEDGLTGRIHFDRRGDIIAPPITILRIRHGERDLPTFPGAKLDQVVRSRGN